MAFVRLELAGLSGGGSDIRHDYILVTTDQDDSSVVAWLNDPGATATDFIQRPDGTTVEGPAYAILDTYAGRQLLRSPDYQLLNFGEPRRWKVTATYGYPSGSQSGTAGTGSANATFAFEAGPDIDRVKYSEFTVAMFPGKGQGVTPETNRAINLRSDGTIEGVQYPQGQPITFTYTNTATWFTPEKILQISRARNKVNDKAMSMGPGGGVAYEAGEVRFLGAKGKISSNADSTIDLLFSVIRNATNVEYPGIDHTTGVDYKGTTLSQIDVDGWDYMWVYYGRGVSGNVATAKPKGLYVERLFEREDLNAIFS